MFFCPIRHSIGILEIDFEIIFEATFFEKRLLHNPGRYIREAKSLLS